MTDGKLRQFGVMRCALVVLLALASPGHAFASLLGQEIRVYQEYSSVGSIFRDVQVTVQAGDVDEVTFGKLDINPEANSVVFTHNQNVAFFAGSGADPANRVTLEDLVWSDSPGSIITGIDVVATFDTVAAGLDLATDLQFGDHFVSLDVQGQNWGLGQTLTVTFRTSQAPVGAPEPAPLPPPPRQLLTHHESLEAWSHHQV